MAFPLASRKFEFVSAPRAYGATGPNAEGQVAVFTVSSVGQVIDLKSLTFAQVPDQSMVGNAQTGVCGNYITIYADGQDLGIIVGLTLASVSGGAAPNLAARGTLGATGLYTGATGACQRIKAGDSFRFMPQVGQDRYLGIVAGATGACRLNQSSGEGA